MPAGVTAAGSWQQAASGLGSHGPGQSRSQSSHSATKSRQECKNKRRPHHLGRKRLQNDDRQEFNYGAFNIQLPKIRHPSKFIQNMIFTVKTTFRDQALALWAFCRQDLNEVMTMYRTRRSIKRIVPVGGDCLYSNLGNKMLEVLEDSREVVGVLSVVGAHVSNVSANSRKL